MKKSVFAYLILAFLAVLGARADWTVLPVRDNAREVFVSSSLGSNLNPGTVGAPVKTLSAGYALMRNGFPDRLKLRRGDSWEEALPSWKKGGESSGSPMVVEAYGDESLARPLLRTGTASGFRREPGGGAPASVNYLAVLDIDFLASTNADVGFWWLGSGDGILVEGCRFTNYSFGMTWQGYTGTVTNVKVNRSVIVDSHSNNSHSSGIYASKYNGFEVRECVFDKNGWKAGVASPTMFNHNAYFDILGDGLVFSGNIVSDASSHGVQLRPGAIAEDNLFYRNPIALQVGFGGTEAGADDNPQHAQFAYVRRNVFMEGRDIDQNNPRGWAMIVEWIDGGEISDNLAFSNQGNYRKSMILSDTGGGTLSAGVRNLSILRNVWYDWRGDFQIDGNSNELRSVLFSQNVVDEPSPEAPVFLHEFTVSSAMFRSSSNLVYAAAGPAAWAEIAGQGRSLNQWKSLVGDTTTEFGRRPWGNPTVTLDDYAVFLGVPDVVAQAREQRRGAWNPGLTGAATSVWVRNQFRTCMADRDGDGAVTVSDLTGYLGEFERGQSSADLNQDGGVDVTDLVQFLAAFETGC